MFVFTSSDWSGTNHAFDPLVGCRWHDMVYHYLQLWYRRWFIVSGKLYYWSKNVSCWNDKSGIFFFLDKEKGWGRITWYLPVYNKVRVFPASQDHPFSKQSVGFWIAQTVVQWAAKPEGSLFQKRQLPPLRCHVCASLLSSESIYVAARRTGLGTDPA